MIKLVIEGDASGATLTHLLGSGMVDAVQMGDQVFVRADEQSQRLLKLVSYYESPLPLMEDGHYKVLNDHRFTDQGICLRCGEDAEEWDAGCVEKIIEDLRSLCTGEIVDSLQRVLNMARNHASAVNPHIERIDAHLDKLLEFYGQFEFGNRLSVEDGDAQEQTVVAGSE